MLFFFPVLLLLLLHDVIAGLFLLFLIAVLILDWSSEAGKGLGRPLVAGEGLWRPQGAGTASAGLWGL